MRDFVAAWTKMMDAERFDLTWRGAGEMTGRGRIGPASQVRGCAPKADIIASAASKGDVIANVAAA